MAEAGARSRHPVRTLLPWLYETERREGQLAMDAFHLAVEVGWDTAVDFVVRMHIICISSEFDRHNKVIKFTLLGWV